MAEGVPSWEIDGLINEVAARMTADALAHGAEAARQLHQLVSEDHGGGEQLRNRVGKSVVLLEALRHLLLSGNDMARYWCCRCITRLSHNHKLRVCDKHTANQSAIARHAGMLEAILWVLMHGSDPSPGAACSALVDLTLCNAENAMLVAKTPMMVRGVLWVMQNSVGDERDDAAGVLRNCANYSQAAAEVIVQTPGVLEALIDLCKGPDRLNAVGTIQNLTRCGSVAHLLCQTRIVADALLLALNAVGVQREHDVMRAEALMAITNLSSPEDITALPPHTDIVAVIVQMLHCAVRGQSWREVAWYDADECLRPLRKMAANPDKRAMLHSVGLLPVLSDLLCYWIEEQAFTLPTALHAEARCVLARVDDCSRAAREPSSDRNDRNPRPPLPGDAGGASRPCYESEQVVDSCIGIGHERLRHAIAVWEVASSRPADAEAKNHNCASTGEAGSDATSSWCSGEPRQACREVRRAGTHKRRGSGRQKVRDRRR